MHSAKQIKMKNQLCNLVRWEKSTNTEINNEFGSDTQFFPCTTVRSQTISKWDVNTYESKLFSLDMDFTHVLNHVRPKKVQLLHNQPMYVSKHRLFTWSVLQLHARTCCHILLFNQSNCCLLINYLRLFRILLRLENQVEKILWGNGY